MIQCPADKISKNYRLALCCFGMPLGVYFLDSATFAFTDGLFLAAFLVSLLPLGVLGLIFNLMGWHQASKQNHTVKKDIGYANFIMGLIIAGGGVLGTMVLYLVTS